MGPAPAAILGRSYGTELISEAVQAALLTGSGFLQVLDLLLQLTGHLLGPVVLLGGLRCLLIETVDLGLDTLFARIWKRVGRSGCADNATAAAAVAVSTVA